MLYYTLIEYAQNKHKSSFFVLLVSFELNLNMHMRSRLIAYVLICMYMYDIYIGPIIIQSSYCQWVMATLLLDRPLTWKLPGLVVPAKGLTPAGIVFRVMEEHNAPHHDKVATTEEGWARLVWNTC